MTWCGAISKVGKMSEVFARAEVGVTRANDRIALKLERFEDTCRDERRFVVLRRIASTSTVSPACESVDTNDACRYSDCRRLAACALDNFRRAVGGTNPLGAFVLSRVDKPSRSVSG